MFKKQVSLRSIFYCLPFIAGAIWIWNQEETRSQVHHNENTIFIRTLEGGQPQSEREFWPLANRLLQPRDFDEDWLEDTYTLVIGTNAVQRAWPYEEVLGMEMCLTRGETLRGKINQQPYCFEQEVTRFLNAEESKNHYATWMEGPLINSFWEEESEFVELDKLVDGLKSNCGDAIIQPERGYYESSNFCEIKMYHGAYFVLINLRFTLDEDPVSWEEIGALINLIQTKMVDPDADKIPEGLMAPVPLGN